MAISLDDATLIRLTDAVVALDPKPRERRWVSLSFAITDAVWSIGANYDTTVVPLVRKVAAEFGVTEPSVADTTPWSADPVPLNVFRDRFDLDSLTSATNRQRTSTSGGILKAEAVLEHVAAFLAEGVQTIDDARELMGDKLRFKGLDNTLRSIRGEGGHGIRRGYLWMLIGDSDRIKPDRMVLRWFRRHEVEVDAGAAAEIVHRLVDRINAIPGRRPTNAWEVDHALWEAGRVKA